jgi:probable HAF family extracellular repeat protein
MHVTALLVGACAALACLDAAAAPSYTVGPVTGKYGTAVALNEAGQVAVNNRESGFPWRGAITGPSGVPDFGTFGGSDNVVHGINNKGDAVGLAQTADGETHAFHYSAGRLLDLSASAGLDNASVINDRGQIAGQHEGRAYVYLDGALEFFGPPDTGVSDINERGDIVGAAVFDGDEPHAYLYSQGKMTDLGGLGGGFSTASAINDLGTIVGYGIAGDGRQRAFMVDAGVMTDIGGLAGTSAAFDINNHGQAVGMADQLPVLFSEGGVTDLNSLIAADSGYRLVWASAINDRGEILATGCNADPTGPPPASGSCSPRFPRSPSPCRRRC